MNICRSFVILFLVLAMTACVAPSRVYHSPDASAPPLQPQVLVLPPDVVVSLFTAGGNQEARADWSREVSDKLNEGLREYLYENGIQFQEYGPVLADKDVATIEHLNVLLDAIELSQVGKTIGGNRTYAISESEISSLEAGQAHYALSVVLRSNRASAGRHTVAILAAIGGVAVETSNAQFRSALVDLRTGHVKWANFDESALVDIGDPLKASPTRWKKAIEHLLREIPL